LIYPGCKIYGPYTRKDGRKHIIAIFPNGKRKTVSYPKYLMEQHLGRYLAEDETVDHIDRDFTNDSIENFRILTRSEHSSADTVRVKEQAFECGICGTEFILFGRKLHDAFHNRKKGSSGPYCGRSCAGKATHNSDRETKLVVKEKYRRNKG